MTSLDEISRDKSRRARSLITILPAVFFLLLAGLFAVSLFSSDPKTIPSVLIGKSVPQFSLPPLAGLMRNDKPVPGIKTADFKKSGPVIVNIWASWCGPCRLEHPFLMQLSKSGKARVMGINYKDVPANARRFLGIYGNPYHAVGVDNKGRTSVDWGVYGVPETFVVDGNGKIVLKHIGPLNANVVVNKILPALKNGSAKPKGLN